LQGTIGAWFEDACAMVDQLTEGPQIVIGSSMGGWLAFLLALKRPERMRALIGIAAGPDFTEDLLLPHMSAEQKAQLEREGMIKMEASPPDDPLPVTKNLIEEARNHLLLRGPLPVACPVRLLQGMQDEDIPWRYALRIAEAIPQGDVRVTFIKDGGHRLSRPGDLELLWRTIGEFT
jgi:pimeloyl-ACP methyl ester carboxylesterase